MIDTRYVSKPMTQAARVGSVYLCAHPGCRRLCIGWLCTLHRPHAVAGQQTPGG